MISRLNKREKPFEVLLVTKKMKRWALLSDYYQHYRIWVLILYDYVLCYYMTNTTTCHSSKITENFLRSCFSISISVLEMRLTHIGIEFWCASLLSSYFTQSVVKSREDASLHSSLIQSYVTKRAREVHSITMEHELLLSKQLLWEWEFPWVRELDECDKSHIKELWNTMFFNEGNHRDIRSPRFMFLHRMFTAMQ